jgi:hypothetical protein
VDSGWLCKAALAVLGDSKKTSAFARNAPNFYDAVWEKPLLYKVDVISLEELVIVCANHVQPHKFVDMDLDLLVMQCTQVC